METKYWWHATNFKKLENGEYFIRDEELEKKIGNLTFSYPEWSGPGLRVRGTIAGRTEIFQYPMNCGHLIMGSLAYSGEAIKLQHFITKNLASACGYGTLSASFKSGASILEEWQALGWKMVMESESSRSRAGSIYKIVYMMYTIPRKEMQVLGYAFSEDKFKPAELIKKVPKVSIPV